MSGVGSQAEVIAGKADMSSGTSFRDNLSGVFWGDILCGGLMGPSHRLPAKGGEGASDPNISGFLLSLPVPEKRISNRNLSRHNCVTQNELLFGTARNT